MFIEMVINCTLKKMFKDFSSGSVVKTVLPMQWAWIQSLVKELVPTCHNRLKIPSATAKTWHGQINKYLKKDQKMFRDFPGGPVVKTALFPCRGHGFDPWSGN